MTKSGTVVVTVAGAPATNICPFGITGKLDRTSIVGGDTATITGKVWDGAGNPLPNAPVDLVSIDQSTGSTLKLASSQTDAYGNYSISYRFDVPADYTLYAQSLAVGPVCANFSVTTTYMVLAVSAPGGGPNSFSLVGSPTQSGSNIAVTYKNNTAGPLSAIVYAVLHNAIGQTVFTTTATLTNVPPGGTSAGTLVLADLASGDVLEFFAVTPSGIVLSATTSISIGGTGSPPPSPTSSGSQSLVIALEPRQPYTDYRFTGQASGWPVGTVFQVYVNGKFYCDTSADACNGSPTDSSGVFKGWVGWSGVSASVYVRNSSGSVVSNTLTLVAP